MFMDTYFNISAYWRSHFEGVKSPARRVINSLADAINKNSSYPLPCIMLILSDADVLKDSAFFGYGASKVFGTIINAWVKEFHRDVANRKEDLQAMRKGSEVESEPKIIWIKAIDRPGRDRILSLREKYNRVLEDTVANFDNTFIFDVDDGLRRNHFDFNNHILPDGMIAYWRRVDQLLRKFEQDPCRFLPQRQDRSYPGNGDR